MTVRTALEKLITMLVVNQDVLLEYVEKRHHEPIKWLGRRNDLLNTYASYVESAPVSKEAWDSLITKQREACKATNELSNFALLDAVHELVDSWDKRLAHCETFPVFEAKMEAVRVAMQSARYCSGSTSVDKETLHYKHCKAWQSVMDEWHKHCAGSVNQDSLYKVLKKLKHLSDNFYSTGRP